MRHVAFVVPYLFETSVRFLQAALGLPDTRVGLISCDPLERFAPQVRERLAGHWRVDDALDPAQLVTAVRGLAGQMGRVDRLVGVLEQLQEPLAVARKALELPGLDPESARRFRDKAHMKDVLAAAGLPCARHALVHTAAEARTFLAQVGYPVVIKPPAGAGAVNTVRLDRPEQLDATLASVGPRPGAPVLIEEFMTGKEHSFDAVFVDGTCVFHSISHYLPSPLEVLENDWIQWCVVLPRAIDGPEYDGIRAAGPAAMRVLGLQTGLAHMEWFLRPDGSVAISEVGARPPGAQFTTLLSVAHDTDMYKAWSRLVIHDRFDPPQRKYAAGAVYLRGQGRGHVRAIHGLEQAQREMGDMVVDVKLPRTGQAAASGYEGEGYAILRHEETAVLVEACKRLVSMVRVELG
ncbi:MAG: ATP-grasp domain-containing protein [Planctomycetes bacterium]|nr:ATP-grasp domain-containing protein [Planctomycetota bacterium]